MDYVLDRINTDNIAELRTKWFQQLDDIEENADYLQNSVERLIDWCQKGFDENHEQCMWAICPTSSNTPRAIVEMTDARRSKDPSYKFLNIHFEPKLILDYKDDITPGDLIDVVTIIAFALIESLKLVTENGTNKLKIFARTQEMQSAFDALLVKYDQAVPDTNIYRQGKWLIVATRK